MLPGSLPAEPAEEVTSKGRVEVAWQDKSEMAQAVAQGWQFCICPPPPAEPVLPSAPDRQLDRDTPGAAAPGTCGESRDRGWQDSQSLHWGTVQLTSR